MTRNLTRVAVLPTTAGFGAAHCGWNPPGNPQGAFFRAQRYQHCGKPPEKAQKPDALVSALCVGERMELNGILYVFFPDGGSTTVQGIKVATGKWRPVARTS